MPDPGGVETALAATATGGWERTVVDAVLAGLPAQAAVLDRTGHVVAVNEAWTRFWEAGGGLGQVGPGTDYLAACEAAAVDLGPAGDGATGECSEGVLAARGIRAVLDGRSPRFSLDYECSSPTREAWFRCEAVPLRTPEGRELAGGLCLVTHTDITGRVVAERRLAQRGRVDPLTGLGTREHLVRVLGSGGAATLVQPVVVVCDLDGFGELNDTYGRDTGDAVLQEVAVRLRRATAGAGSAYRTGPDELAALLPGGPDAGERLALAVHAALRAPVLASGQEVAVTTCAGVAAVPEHDGPAGLLSAEAATQHAAALGRSRTTVWTAQLHGAAAHRRDVAAGLRAVLDGGTGGGAGGTGDGGLRLYRQPVVTVREGEVRGWEVLLRWHRDGAVLPPAAFLPVVAGTPLALELDLWALSTACEGLRREAAAAAGGPDRTAGPRVSVNAAPGSLADRRYLDRLLDELDRDPWLGSRLGIEVTEEAAAHDEVAAVLAAVRARGVRVLLDDFGTGWSSLTNLVRLPVDSLKVDRLFVERLATREGQAVVGAVVSMAGALGLSVVVEGIETDRQRDQVLALGGTLGQGFLWSEPVDWV